MEIAKGLGLDSGFRKGGGLHASFPHAALFHQINALEPLEHVALSCGGILSTKTSMHCHKGCDYIDL